MYLLKLYRVSDTGKEEEISSAEIEDEEKAEYIIHHVIPFCRK